MKDLLRCVNLEWQGCESPVLKKGAIRLAKELFGSEPYINLGCPESVTLNMSHGVYALDVMGTHFKDSLTLLQSEGPDKIITVGATCGNEAVPITFLMKNMRVR